MKFRFRNHIFEGAIILAAAASIPFLRIHDLEVKRLALFGLVYLVSHLLLARFERSASVRCVDAALGVMLLAVGPALTMPAGDHLHEALLYTALGGAVLGSALVQRAQPEARLA